MRRAGLSASAELLVVIEAASAGI